MTATSLQNSPHKAAERAAAGSQPATAVGDWWESFHIDELADLFLVRSDPRELAATLDFLTDRLGIVPRKRVFDQCCGIGSLAIPLAARGAQLVGVDLAPGYIRRADEDASAQGAACGIFL